MLVTDTVTTPTVTYPVTGGILEPAIWQPPGAASWNHPGYGSHHSKETSQTHSHITDISKYSKITFIDNLARITSNFKLLSLGLVWMES
jgi:hypothetical protein